MMDFGVVFAPLPGPWDPHGSAALSTAASAALDCGA